MYVLYVISAFIILFVVTGIGIFGPTAFYYRINLNLVLSILSYIGYLKQRNKYRYSDIDSEYINPFRVNLFYIVLS